MANIAISELNPVGFDLFSDSESYMVDLSDNELTTSGGISPVAVAVGTVALGFGAAALLDRYF
ncbi:hypothetical protein [Dapis sp. BLCC M229]|uniref:hypothetical protein n=1 Tax=Dapis sp. BLCC M229 TaxID=3400188 RepID=UPI003CED25C3